MLWSLLVLAAAGEFSEVRVGVGAANFALHSALLHFIRACTERHSILDSCCESPIKMSLCCLALTQSCLGH